MAGFKSLELSKCRQGFSFVGLIAALVLFAVIISGAIAIINRGDKEDSVMGPQKEQADIEQVSTTVPKPLEFRSEAGEIFPKAEKALKEGNHALAKELMNEAIMQELKTVKENKSEGGEILESYEEAKRRALPVLKKMWDFHAKVIKEEKVAVAENDIPNDFKDQSEFENIDEGDKDSVDPEDLADPEAPEEQPTDETSEKTCCGGWTEQGLYDLYYVDPDRMWAILWTCKDLEKCL